MEDTLRGVLDGSGNPVVRGLNPCFNGRYSQRGENEKACLKAAKGLNPCFNGRYSQSYHV